VWVFGYHTEEDGRRVYKKKIVVSVIEFPKRKGTSGIRQPDRG
jgi:hypothetical protein